MKPGPLQTRVCSVYGRWENFFLLFVKRDLFDERSPERLSLFNRPLNFIYVLETTILVKYIPIYRRP